jgi:hypothetical protein
MRDDDNTGAAAELERLGEELSRRGLRVTLAPEGTDLVLEVINPRPYNMRAVRLIWSGAAFCWVSGEPLPNGADLPGAVETVTGALHRRSTTLIRQAILGAATPAPEAGTNAPGPPDRE